jgi:hypothetical protein
MTAYFVTVQRRGIAPHEETLLVRAGSPQVAEELATALVERQRGGLFTPKRIRPAADPALDTAAYDAVA